MNIPRSGMLILSLLVQAIEGDNWTIIIILWKELQMALKNLSRLAHGLAKRDATSFKWKFSLGSLNG
jgi:hypothetical protein